MSLTKTKIEYLDFAWNFYTGCEQWRTGVCPVGTKCWAYQRAQRFNGGDFSPALHPEKLLDPLKHKAPARIGVCFTGDLFGDWVDPKMDVKNPEYLERHAPLIYWVFKTIRDCPQHTFLFLTKNPKGLLPWGKFPDNAWPGATVCNQQMFNKAIAMLAQVEAKHKWLSFEPFMEEIVIQPGDLDGISWLTLGGWSRYSPKTAPKMSWIQGILVAADNPLNIPIFMKDNLEPLMVGAWAGWKLRKEYPRELIKE